MATKSKAGVYYTVEYQAMPSLRDIAHDGVQCTVHLVIDQPRPGQVVWSNRAGGISAHHTYKITPCWVTLLQSARRAAVLGQSSSLRSHWWLLGYAAHWIVQNKAVGETRDR
jgi:hypothetical protein